MDNATTPSGETPTIEGLMGLIIAASMQPRTPLKIVSDIRYQAAAQDGTVDTAMTACCEIEELCGELLTILQD